jgi:hypothetical protein
MGARKRVPLPKAVLQRRVSLKPGEYGSPRVTTAQRVGGKVESK